jgi:hypothetical protein
MRRFYMTEEQRELEMEIGNIRKMVRRAKSPRTRNNLVTKQEKLVAKLHGLGIDKRHSSY